MCNKQHKHGDKPAGINCDIDEVLRGNRDAESNN
jgi:hypothetical protein